MQELRIQDPDGVTRKYAYDTYDGRLFVRDEAGRNPGRPYRPIYTCKQVDAFGIERAHREMWADASAAAAALASDAPQIAWRSAH